MADITVNPALRQMLQGAYKLSEAVIPNYGPTGKNTICDQEFDLPMIANSGRKVLDGFSLPDSVENLGAVLLRDAALKVGQTWGGGTLTTVVLADALLRKGETAVAAGVNPIFLRRGMEKGMGIASAVLKEHIIPCAPETLFSLIVSTAKDEKIGEIVYRAVSAVGDCGIITVQDSQNRETVLRIHDGAYYTYGMAGGVAFLDEIKKETRLQAPRVLLVNYRLKAMEEIIQVLSQSAESREPLLIIAADFSDELTGQLTRNIRSGRLVAAAALAPGHGENRRRNMLSLAAKTGALLFDEHGERELKSCGLEVCGSIGRAIVRKDGTQLQGFPMESAEMVDMLKAHTQERLSLSLDPEQTELLEETMAILNGSAAEIIVGGITEYEMFEKKYLAENAVRAAHFARTDGLLPGGGEAYLLALDALKKEEAKYRGDEKYGMEILRHALTAPLRVLDENRGEKSQEPVFDAAMTALGALENAVSIAGTLLTAAAAVTR